MVLSPFFFTHVSPVLCLSTNVRDESREVYVLRGVFSTPSPPRRSPPPINRGRAPPECHPAWVTTYYLLLTTYYLLPTTYSLLTFPNRPCPSRCPVGFVVVSIDAARSIVGILFLREEHGESATIEGIDMIVGII